MILAVGENCCFFNFFFLYLPFKCKQNEHQTCTFTHSNKHRFFFFLSLRYKHNKTSPTLFSNSATVQKKINKLFPSDNFPVCCHPFPAVLQQMKSRNHGDSQPGQSQRKEANLSSRGVLNMSSLVWRNRKTDKDYSHNSVRGYGRHSGCYLNDCKVCKEWSQTTQRGDII